MNLSVVLFSLVIFLGATAVCVILFQRLGFGSVLGFIVAGVIIGILSAAWAVDFAGISMTLGAFLMGILLSVSDYRYQIEATVAPYKETLMGLFFVAVGMSIDVSALAQDWSELLVHVPVIVFLKGAVLIALALAFGLARSTAVRTGFYLSQAGEFGFVLLGATAAAGLLSTEGHTISMLLVSVTMILTPLLIKAGDQLAGRLQVVPRDMGASPGAVLERHVAVIGYSEVGALICLILEKAGMPYVAFDRNIAAVRRGKRLGHNVHFGDINSTVTQHAAGLAKATAACLTGADMTRTKSLAMNLQRLYPKLDIYVRVRTLADQDELVAGGIKHAGTGLIESTLLRGNEVLKDLGVAETEVEALMKALRENNYALIRSALTEPARDSSG